GAEATAGRWLELAPKARFIATSREVLRLADEAIYEVPPLKLPERDDDIEASEAVQLFLERARTARPGYQLSGADRLAVAEIVRQLDGLPLAIELAAARMAVLSPAQLMQRLPRRFDLLAGKLRGASDRQATLRGAIDWSWGLMQPHEQSALAQCALFRGGFTTDAAGAVIDLSAFAPALKTTPSARGMVLLLRQKSLVRSYFPAADSERERYG